MSYKPREDFQCHHLLFGKKHTVCEVKPYFDRGKGALVIAVTSLSRLYTNIQVLDYMRKVKPRMRKLTSNNYECCRQF